MGFAPSEFFSRRTIPSLFRVGVLSCRQSTRIPKGSPSRSDFKAFIPFIEPTHDRRFYPYDWSPTLLGLRIPEVFSLAAGPLCYKQQLFCTSCVLVFTQGHCTLEFGGYEIGWTNEGLPTSAMFLAFSVIQSVWDEYHTGVWFYRVSSDSLLNTHSLFARHPLPS